MQILLELVSYGKRAVAADPSWLLSRLSLDQSPLASLEL
jgi:hypothetical protein